MYQIQLQNSLGFCQQDRPKLSSYSTRSERILRATYSYTLPLRFDSSCAKVLDSKITLQSLENIVSIQNWLCGHKTFKHKGRDIEKRAN